MRHTILIASCLGILVNANAQHLRVGTSSQLDKDTWTDLSRQNVYFDGPGGQVDSMIVEEWDQQLGSWVYQIRSTFDHSAPGQYTELEELWDTELGEWALAELNTTTLDNGVATSQLLQWWDGADWQPLENVLFTYDGQGRMISRMEQGWTGSDWADRRRREYTYDSAGNRIVDRLDTLGTQWITVEVDSSTFDGDGLESERWNWWRVGGELIPQRHHVYTYNGSEELIGEVIAQPFLGGLLVPFLRFEYVPVGDGLSDQHNYFNTEFFGEPVWSYTGRLLWSEPIPTAISTSAEPALSIHPNPTNGPCVVVLPAHATQDAVLQVHDTGGRLVHAQRARAGNNIIDAALATGSYVVSCPGLPGALRFMMQ